MYTLRDPGATSEGTRYRPHLANFGAPSLLPWSDRLRPAVRCGGVAPPTAGRSRLRRRRRPLSRPRAGLRASEPREWPLTDTVTKDRLSQSSPPLIVDSLESLTARVNAS